jgi:superfamily II DNA or RNA helicase
MGIMPHFVVNWEMARTGNFQPITRTHDEWANKWHYHWPKLKDMLTIFDEVHCASNDSTINNQLWRGMRPDFKNPLPHLALSATLADRPIRLASLFEMLGICNRASYVQWMRSRGSFVNQHQEEESISSVQDMKEINRMLYPRYGTRLSYDDLDVRTFFPECVYQIELVDLGRAEMAATNKAYEKLLAKVNSYKEAGITQADKLVAALRFRQAAELQKVPILAEYVNDYLSEGLSVIVFVNYRETLAALAQILNTRSLIFGDQESFKLPRQPVIDAFQKNESRLILAMSEAGGQSIDLHDLEGGHRRISLICPTYNPVTLKQVLGRTRRAKSKTTPIMKLFYAAGTVEEKVARAVSLKLDNIEALNKGDMMEPDLFNLLGGEE